MTIYNWEIGYMSYVLKPDPIISPPFYIEPSRTFKFCLELHPFGRGLLNNSMILVLLRCDRNERNIELRYTLRLDSAVGTDGTNTVKHGTYTYNFITPMQFPESEVYLTKPVTGYERVLRITCMILNHNIFQDVDEDIMTELSSQYELLLNGNAFSDYRVHVDNRDFYIHNAILEARCKELAGELNTLELIDPSISRSILEFLYSGRLTTLTPNIPVLMKFGSSLLKTMYPSVISEYSVKTLFEGKCYSFDWVIENFFYVRSETIFTYVISKGGTIIQLSFFPCRVNFSNFYVETFEYVGCFIRCRVDIKIGNIFITLAEMSNTATNPSLLVVNRFTTMNWVMNHYTHYATDGAIELKIYIHTCSFNSNSTSNVDVVSCTNVSNHTIHMYNLREDFKKLFNQQLYYDFEIIVEYRLSNEDYERHCVDYARFSTDYAKIHAYVIDFYAHSVRFRVHKAILSARSPVFRAQLSHDTMDNRTGEITIPDIKPYVLHKMLLFMYCGQLNDLNLDLALDLNYAADKYDIKMLKRKCSEFLESIMREDNVDIIREHALLHCIEQLKSACDRFQRNINII